MTAALCAAWLLAEAWATILLTTLRVRTGWGRERLVARALAWSAEDTIPPSLPELRAFRRAAAVQPLPCTCLPRSIALAGFLRRHGHRAGLELGMKRAEAGLTGHAWVADRVGPVVDTLSFVSTFTILHRGAGR